jgi:hypothetical protein
MTGERFALSFNTSAAIGGPTVDAPGLRKDPTLLGGSRSVRPRVSMAVCPGELSFRMYRNTPRRTGMALRGRASPADAVGCDHPELRDHIAARLRTGMCWEGRRQWKVDHVEPLSSAQTLSELIALCHYGNLQPLWRSENLRGEVRNTRPVSVICQPALSRMTNDWLKISR